MFACSRAALALLAAIPAAAHADNADGADILVTGRALPPETGQALTTIPADVARNMPAATVADLVRLSPGVAVIMGNGPRDVGISLRGSNARNGFGARNIVVFEDGFPVTQPDGLARFDLTDPHAYAALDVARGPSSARYGNYALGGAIDFRTRTGHEVDGIDGGLDMGGHGYRNLYATIGGAGETIEGALFGSYVRADGATGHSGYRTGTANALVTWAPGPRDRITAKLIYNASVLDLPIRLSLNQYRANPYQQRCGTTAGAAPGCATIAVFLNGRNGPRENETAAQGGLGRDDRRTIAGLRYEHDLAADTVWRTQAVFDSRIPFQPTNASPFVGRVQSWNVMSDVTRRGRLLGMDTLLFAGLTYSRLSNESLTYNKAPGGRDALGALAQSVFGHIENKGARARAELGLARDWRLVLAVGAERSAIAMGQTAFAYPSGGAVAQTFVPVDRHFTNVAPEAALLWSPMQALRLHARFATGYGIPQSGALFVTSAGVPGDNGALRTQTNRGGELGAQIALGHRLTAELTAWQEWFHNEQVSQSAGANLLAFTTNAPRSRHRGIEAGLGWKPLAGVSLAASYSYTDQRYTRYVERLSAGGKSALFDRAGNRIPGVIPHFANVRLGYDRPSGALKGLGGYVETQVRGAYAIDNANLLRVPGYALLNLNLHYDRGRTSLYASIANLMNRAYAGSANVVADSLNAGTGSQNGIGTLRDVTGSIYAGSPRTFTAGVRVTL